MANKEVTHKAVPGAATIVRPDALMPTHAAELKIFLPFGFAALIGAVASAATCYGTIFASAILGVPKLGLNPHVQAVLMWAFALIAVFALWQDRKRHRNNLPTALGAVALAVLIMTLYVEYSTGVETFAYVLLLVAAFVNQTIFLTVLNRTTRDQAREIELLNLRLEQKVESQVHVIDRLARLKQFLAPEVANLIVSEGSDKLLETHRRYIACLFCDIRDFTSVSEEIEPEEVIGLLHAYHERIGGLVTKHRGTIGYRAGDGLMAFFNDPLPCETPVLDAVKLALDIRAAFDDIRAPWTKQGHAIGLGIAIASGYATLGVVGFQGRADYTAIGGVVNIASRLCDKASDGQILLTRRAYLDVESDVQTTPLGAFELKGVKNSIEVFGVVGLSESAS